MQLLHEPPFSSRSAALLYLLCKQIQIKFATGN